MRTKGAKKKDDEDGERARSVAAHADADPNVVHVDENVNVQLGWKKKNGGRNQDQARVETIGEIVIGRGKRAWRDLLTHARVTP